MQKNHLKKLKDDTYDSWKALGSEDILNSNNRKGGESARSLYFVKNVHKGEKICEKHIRSIRPGFGLSPKLMHKVIGMIARKDIERGTAVSWELLSE